MKISEKDEASRIREKRQLRRLEVVMDVVYAILIWRAFQLLPRPVKSDRSLEGMKVLCPRIGWAMSWWWSLSCWS